MLVCSKWGGEGISILLGLYVTSEYYSLFCFGKWRRRRGRWEISPLWHRRLEHITSGLQWDSFRRIWKILGCFFLLLRFPWDDHLERDDDAVEDVDEEEAEPVLGLEDQIFEKQSDIQFSFFF